MKREADIKLTTAIKSNNPVEWRMANYLRNRYSKALDKVKTLYYQASFKKDYNLWGTIKTKENSLTPMELAIKGKRIKSPKKIATEFDHFYKNKIKKIKDKFTNPEVDPIEILRKLVPKPKNKFTIPLIMQQECFKLIKNMKSSNSTGMADINSRFIKLIPKATSMYMTHMIDRIIRSKKCPRILKGSKVFPILKQGKNSTNPSRYCPISNLSVFDKIAQGSW